MASFLNSWVQGIVIAIVLATVLEMLLPEGNNKKYVKILIGIYILFTIISPVMNKAGKIEVKNSILDTKQYQKEIEKYSVDANTMQEQNQKSIQTIYQQNLKSDMTNKLEEKGYQVNAVHIRVSNEGDYLLEEVRLQLTKAENKETSSAKKDVPGLSINNKPDSEAGTISPNIPFMTYTCADFRIEIYKTIPVSDVNMVVGE